MVIELQELKKRWGIGLTGGIACGKSTVADILRAKNFPVIDADLLAREAVLPNTPGLAMVVDHFGGGVLNNDGTLNRTALGETIFRDHKERQALEQIIHPIIHQLLHRHLEQEQLFANPRFWFYEASLLYEAKIAIEFRQVWVIVCPKDVQESRIRNRDHRTRDTIRAIIKSQMPNSEKAKLADVVIDTNCSLAELDTKVRLHVDKLPGLSGITPLQQT